MNLRLNFDEKNDILDIRTVKFVIFLFFLYFDLFLDFRDFKDDCCSLAVWISCVSYRFEIENSFFVLYEIMSLVVKDKFFITPMPKQWQHKVAMRR